MLDVRAIANFVLDYADECGVGVTNMALNKIVYFVHCDYLIKQREPLVGAKIEAWQHGPVFREIYHEFKRWDDTFIKSRANKVDPHTGDVIKAGITFGLEEKNYIKSIVERYIRFSAAHLRAISHRDGGPWHRVWGHDGRSNPGMKITDDLIMACYSSGARQ
jgi:uncharacterized phage-associated protein